MQAVEDKQSMEEANTTRMQALGAAISDLEDRLATAAENNAHM